MKTKLLWLVIIGASAGVPVYVQTDDMRTAGWAALFATILLFSFWLYRFIKKRRTGLGYVDRLDGYAFESYIAELLKASGYKHVSVTQGSSDFGADLVIDTAETRIVLQAKRYNSTIGVRAVQEVYTAMPYYEADMAWVVSNSYYTKAAHTLASAAGVTLIDRDELERWMKDTRY
ncbi:restriction endonuclease [Salsuginibacillus halophilus]|uniref:Restriction endonuclease n=1 Tax=Salsuginibacillus halophilus TaxID=517424 RepID=A0A2P8HQL4_9BACI|nr:restriction endonuclease [Salsuginibacillus halophilus]PSL48482.1 restriction endonuclease [Salsuginibacillus halophilus]